MLHVALRRAFSTHRIFTSQDIPERMRLFREERSTVSEPAMFSYPSYLREINAKDLQLYIE
jgi:hypothetical protein